ncbi:MAG TPA: glycoside hydrolase family 9 protein [Oligoflexus sp.]|uniref:glycoside hydrolase family 9 protein n=1 Tax=Oligoflexus sp. TaxID=1971216 RepID=UPI002D27526A|nr:glycoside hydrolase family 9 protein [Oligoflexus sp.]HYX37173.1 glycoside hydrolase family 9 protein [Oligoflexus sp.]
MVAPATQTAQVLIVNRDWIQIVLPEREYNAGEVSKASNYVISSVDDPTFKGGVSPSVIQRRHWPESAPWSDDDKFDDAAKINVTYRIFLKLPSPLQEGKAYRLSVNSKVKIGGSYAFTWDKNTANEAIHVNQVAYLANGPKIAYLSSWTGQGTIDFGAAKTFEVIDEAAQRIVYSGDIKLDVTADKEPWSRSNVYSLDFSSFSIPGRYHIRIPTVGSSYSFQVSPSAFNDIGYTLIRGMMHQRDGEHGLDSQDTTHWNRPPAHLDDAIIESTGQQADLSGGHMDAGDRGKYPHNSADMSASLLTAIRLFPGEVEALGESLQMPESGNGIPDLIDEVVHELDFLHKVVMNTPKDGTVPFYLRPQKQDGSGGYEMGQPPEGKSMRKLYDKTMGPNRSETLYAAGVLAMAYNTPLMQQYVPSKCKDYLIAARRAFHGFKKHHKEPSYFKDAGWYDPWQAGPNPWSDEMLVAAANLLEATGDQAYVELLKSALPADLKKVKHWSWSLTGPWLAAYVSLYSGTDARTEKAIPGIRKRAREAIMDWGDTTMGHSGQPYATPFGAPLPRFVSKTVGWYFSGDAIAFPAMVAYGVTHDPKYRDVIIKTWNYLLGSNPLSRTFITGLGHPQRRPRWMVHEIGHYKWQEYKRGEADGWPEIVPGIPSADIQNGEYDGYMNAPWNTARKNKKFPAQAQYPALYRYHDSWTVKNEFTIDRMARGAVSILPLIARPKPDSTN